MEYISFHQEISIPDTVLGARATKVIRILYLPLKCINNYIKLLNISGRNQGIKDHEEKIA